MSVDLVEQRCTIGIVYLEPGALLLDEEDILQFFEVVEVLDACLMLLSIDHLVADVVVLDDILEAAVVAEQAELDDVVAELLPLHRLIAVDVDLLEEVDQREGELQLEFGVVPVVVEVLQHDRNELIDGQTLVVLLEALLYHSHLLLVQHLQDLSLSDLVRFLVPALLLVHSNPL